MLRAPRSAAFVLAGVLLSACSTDRPTTALEPTAPSASVTLPGRSTSDLREQERLERERIRQAREGSGPLFAALQQEWNAGGGQPRRGSPVLACAPQSYAADVQVVGPAGGVLRAGPHTLAIPRGALTVPTVITMESPVGSAAQVRLSPHGLQFAVAPTLTLSYRACTSPDQADLAVAYVTGEMEVLEWPTSSDRKQGDLVAEIWHFSRYAVSSRSTYAVSW